MIAPAPSPVEFWYKWELLDHLMTDEVVNGPFTVKEALIALASIKADILRFGLKEESGFRHGGENPKTDRPPGRLGGRFRFVGAHGLRRVRRNRDRVLMPISPCALGGP